MAVVARGLVAGLGVGAGLGVLSSTLGPRAPRLAWLAQEAAPPAGQLFVRVLVAVVIPLAITSLLLSLADLEVGTLRRLGARLLLFAAASSAVASLIGLLLVTAVGPGRGVAPAHRAAPGAAPASFALAEPGPPPPAPRSPPSASPLPSPSPWTVPLLALLLATIATGLALGRARGARAAGFRAGVEGLHALSTRAASLVMAAAPLGVGALLMAMTARLGAGALRPLLAYVAVVVAGLLLHGGGVYALAVRFLGGMSPVAFFRGAREAIVTAFSTSSSAATLPTALRVAEEELRVPPAVARFVLTAGSAMNQNGTSLFEGVTVLFLAQVYGVELSALQQGAVMAITVLAGIGSAGVPGGGMVAITTLLALFGIPLEGVGLVMGVDRLLDMCRTTVNVLGDLVLAVIVARTGRS